ncbi:MAG: hypothetical protein IJE77_04535 [Thermoguttaceae bacterium]|nr:hypothetical protein [Thermoguttaceae bacterium]
MFWGGGRFMKAFAAEIAGDYDSVSASYEAYKSGKLIEHKRGCVVTSEPRLAYKQGKTDEAFRGYCDFFALDEEGASEKETANEPARYRRLRFPNSATSTIFCGRLGSGWR